MISPDNWIGEKVPIPKPNNVSEGRNTKIAMSKNKNDSPLSTIRLSATRAIRVSPMAPINPRPKAQIGTIKYSRITSSNGGGWAIDCVNTAIMVTKRNAIITNPTSAPPAEPPIWIGQSISDNKVPRKNKVIKKTANVLGIKKIRRSLKNSIFDRNEESFKCFLYARDRRKRETAVTELGMTETLPAIPPLSSLAENVPPKVRAVMEPIVPKIEPIEILMSPWMLK